MKIKHTAETIIRDSQESLEKILEQYTAAAVEGGVDSHPMAIRVFRALRFAHEHLVMILALLHNKTVEEQREFARNARG